MGTRGTTRGSRQEDGLAGTPGEDRRRIARRPGHGTGGVRSSRLSRSAGVRRGGPRFRRDHGHMWDGDAPGPDALEPCPGFRHLFPRTGGLIMKLLIVGGVAGGASAAARARRLAEDASIVLFERGPDVSFANCGLPYYLGGEITERDKLLIVTPQRMQERYRLDVRARTSVESIDRAARTVQVRDLAGGRTYEERYDKLILSPGAAPLRPPLPGID